MNDPYRYEEPIPRTWPVIGLLIAAAIGILFYGTIVYSLYQGG